MFSVIGMYESLAEFHFLSSRCYPADRTLLIPVKPLCYSSIYLFIFCVSFTFAGKVRIVVQYMVGLLKLCML
jgi:hypothetical protein